MKWNKKRSCLVLLSAVLCGMAIFLKPEENLKAVNTVTTDLPQGESLSRNNIGSNNPPKHVRLDGIFTLPKNTQSFLQGNMVVVTTDWINQEGAVWSTSDNMMDLTKDFQFEAALYLGRRAGNNGDGMTFAMHNDPARLTSTKGLSGKYLGVYGNGTSWQNFTNGALKKSFVVEFDTFFNSESSDKDTYPVAHIAYAFPDQIATYTNFQNTNNIVFKHNKAVQVRDLASSDMWRILNVSWDVATQKLTYKFGEQAAVEVPLDVQGTFGTSEVYWGFTGTTGEAYSPNRAVFTKVPGLVNSESSATIRDKSGASVAGKTVEAREILTYEMSTTYLSGKQTWEEVNAVVTTNPYVDYLPGTLKVDGVSVDDTSFLADKNYFLGDLSLTSPERHVTFDVRTKELSADQTVTEVMSFEGLNHIENLPAISYTIAERIVKDNIAIDTIEPFNTAKKVTGTWQLEDLREMKDVQYQINDGSWVTLPEADYGQNVDSTNKWNVPVSQAVIDALDINKQHTFKIKGVPVELAFEQTDVQATAKFAIKPQSITMIGDVTDKTTSIKGTGTPGLTVQLKNEQGDVIKEVEVDSNGNYALEPLTPISSGTKLTISQKTNFAESEKIAITVAHNVVEPTLTLTDAGQKLKLTNGATYDVKTVVSGSEADSFVLKYAINGVVNESLTKVVANPTADQKHSTTTTIPAASLPIGVHTISVSVEWQTGGAKVTAPAIELTVVAGGLKFSHVAAATSFEQGKITNKTQTLARQDDWNIQIEDFRGTGSQTTLYAKLSTTFKNKDNRVISNPLKYVNEQNQELAMPVGSTVKVFQKETTENFANVDVSWQKNQGILFDLKPGNYQGEYQAEIEWLLSDTP